MYVDQTWVGMKQGVNANKISRRKKLKNEVEFLRSEQTPSNFCSVLLPLHPPLPNSLPILIPKPEKNKTILPSSPHIMCKKPLMIIITLSTCPNINPKRYQKAQHDIRYTH